MACTQTRGNGAITARASLWLVLVFAVIAAGCTTAQLEKVRHAYGQSDYATAYREAERIVQRFSGRPGQEAAYFAGMSAYHLQEPGKALDFLRIAAESHERTIAGRAMAQAGLIHHEKRHYEAAARLLQDAAGRLSGEDRARAGIRAAAAQQKLGRWAQAAANLREARRTSNDPDVHRHVDDHLTYGAYTIQLGAFTVDANARRVAHAATNRAAAIQIGPPRMLRAVDANGRRLILVQVGRFNDYAAASSARSRLATAGDIVPLVTNSY